MRQIISLGITVLVLGALVLVLRNNNFPFNKITTTSQEVPQVKKYEGNNLIFSYPYQWHPNPVELGSQLEAVSLGVPNLTADQELEFLATPLNELDFSDLDTQDYQTFNEREWMIGTKKMPEGITYLFYTHFPVESEEDPRQSFGLHVTVDKEDQQLERQLKDLVASIKFK